MHTAHYPKDQLVHSHWWIIFFIAVACMVYALLATQQSASQPSESAPAIEKQSSGSVNQN